MRQAVECVNGENNITDLKEITMSNSKDMGIIESFLISVSAGVFIEAVKYVIKRVKNRDNYNDNMQMKINDKVYSLHELEENDENK